MTAPEEQPPGKGKDDGAGAWGMAHAGFEFAAVTALLTLGGWWLDGKFGSGPWLMLIALGVGLVGGMYKLWRTGKRYFD